MIPITVFAGKKVAVFGLGKSGLLSAGALIKGGADVVVYDDNEKSANEARAAGLDVRNLAEIDWSEISALVLAPGVPLTHPTPHWTVQRAHKHNVEIIGDIELFCRERDKVRAEQGIECPVIAITGTNGKSTTTALTTHLVAAAGHDAQMGGNIGVPVLALEPFAPGRVYVLEVSSYQIDLSPSLRATVGILTNVTEDHLDRHGTMENYAAIKALLPARVEAGGTAVIGVDDRWTRDAAARIERAGRKVVRVSVVGPLRDGYYAEGTRIVGAVAGKAHPVVQLAGIGSLRGAHNAQNAACAVAACVALGIDLPTIQKGLVSFPGLAHRMQQVGRKKTASGGILYVNDSKATNADSAAKALGSFNDIYWIAGGKPKTGGIVSLAEFFPRIRKAYLIGEAARDFAQTLDGQVPYEIAGVMSAAIDAATRDAEAAGLKEPVVLLSPACASFDQYPNFEVRGKAFVDLVLAVPGVEQI
ncbi:UDP-N-acetylmuramoyl-L-alanine--D-glutamate ligase [Pseudolabrys taiwanensis]|uniref:UDP-N-acetylmuramoylalanine--D-glutamate ligase n=1 Tax=Pseudolabrys taiwanensis TaxID=331696 RepID=A0A346A2Y9_9HYPH|nr:UDP-N-acetylmuramoyl-L-alanine--D-glutamate ligase [Pseudolabrys taiwanensis]AXK83536.1 UDP-N-acetylmuramoyl-L-alanine--D-glutamate ligase [Pseudolabrys taiwanensis]